MTQETKAAIQKEAEELYPVIIPSAGKMALRKAYIAGRTKSIEEIESLKRRLASYKRKEAAREREIERLKAEINRLTMENMTHEYNQAEAEKYAPEFEKQIREDEREKMKAENERLRGLIKYAIKFGYDCGMGLTTPNRERAWQQFCKDNGL